MRGAGLRRDAIRSQVIDALEAQRQRRPAMKKISTAEGKQARNFEDRQLTIGLDLGDRSSWYCVLDETGEVLLEQKLSTTPKAMREVFGAMPRSRIALETGMHSPWVSRLLSELGHEVIVAHARNVRLIGESLLEQKLGNDSERHARYVRKNAAQPDRAGNGDAFTMGEPVVERVGTRSDRGACAERALDRGELAGTKAGQRLRKPCARCSEECRAAGSRWKRGCIHHG